jgi:D-amino-acid dehydrogenase
MRVVVMGAGLAGVTTAWMLARDGHEVAVIDREPQVAAAASFANGGIIAPSRAFPWPGPQMLPVLFKALVRNDQAIRLRLQLDPDFWLWGLKFLACCSARRYAEILDAKVRLVRYSQQRLAAIVAETGIQYRRLTNGVLYLYRSTEALERGWQRAETMRTLGFAIERLDAEGAKRLEPGLRREALAGALYAPGDEAGDSALFCRELARHCERLGVRFHLECEIFGLDVLDNTVKAVLTRKGRVLGDAFVCALGVMAPKLREQFATSLPIYPVKGYSATVAVADAAAAPRHAGMDESKLIAYCPLGDRIRITGGAEFAGYGKTQAPSDFARLYGAFDELYPGAAEFKSARTWACQRPMTPESTPRFGTGRHTNLWYNVGHGHMGWAMAAGAARITADLVSGRAPEISLEGLRIRR